MFVLGIQGSPRKNGNSDYLLKAFLEECRSRGARTEVIHTPDLDIQPCKELIVCEKKGFCPLKDRMETIGYQKVKAADVVVLASPVFFYGITAQAKIFIDRCQMFWGRRYKMKLRDPDRFTRQGFLLSVAASAGKRLFEGTELTARYFFDAISADYYGSLTYKKVEDAGDIIVRPELGTEIEEAVSHLFAPLESAKKLLFVSPGGSGRSPMAAAFAKEMSKGKIRAVATGLDCPETPSAPMLNAMTEISMDLKYQPLFSFDELPGLDTEWQRPDRVVFLGSEQEYQGFASRSDAQHWEMAALGDDPAGNAAIRDRIEGLVADLVEEMSPEG